jgi:hypothetical protein
LVVVGDRVFSILPKILDWETVLGTLGDALIPFFLCNFDCFHLYLKRSKFVCARTLTNTIVQREDMDNECILRSSYIIVF